MPDFIIDDSTSNDVLFPKAYARGLVPRDYAVDPEWMFSPPSEMPDMDLTEIADRIKEHEVNQSSLRHLRRRMVQGKPMPSLNQGQFGYCWMYSVVGTVMMQRAVANLPYVRLNPHGPASKVKNFRNEGGWCGLGAQFVRVNGAPDEKHWPGHSTDRSLDNKETWENARLHRITEDYVDLSRPVHSQNLTKKQCLISLVLNHPGAYDFNHWWHSVLMLAATLLKNASQSLTLDDFGLLGLNSWTDGWGDMGEFELRGQKSIPNGAICTRVTTPSSN